jgi:LCP family protein required for cell wall assembly
MPWHRSTGVPKAHWVLLALGLIVIFGALVLAGISRYPGVGTSQPGRVAGSGYAPTIVEPVTPPANVTLPRLRMAELTMAFTFDDGPDPVWTPRILDTLAQYGVKATFFVVGARVNEHPELVRRIVAEGHELGLHSFSHRNLVDLPTWEQATEIEMTRVAVANATGLDIRLFRPPFLGTSADVDPRARDLIDLAAARGYTTVLGDLDTKDWLLTDHEAIAGAAAPFGSNGAITILHDGGGDRSRTVSALNLIIPALLETHHFVTISQGLAAPDAPPPPARASGQDQLHGAALATAQRLAEWASDGVFWILLPATGLAVVRMVIQVFYARRHRRRNPATAGDWRPPLSVIVPAHNEAANIVETVRSLLRNRYPTYQIIVVDDGSTDGTADLVRALALTLDAPNVQVIRQGNGGKASALRRGIAAAEHDIIVLIDGDTIVERDTLARLVQPLREDGVGAVAGNAKVANRGGLLGRWQHVEYVVTFNLDRRVFDQAQCMPTVPGALGAFRRDALLAAGDITSETLAEDTDVTMAICRAGWRVVYVDSARAWTEAPGSWSGLWRQRYRWCYGTMQAMWKHRSSLGQRGASGKLGRRGLSYIFFFQILQPLLAPLIDLYLLYSLLFQPFGWPILLWLALYTAQLAVAWYAFRLDQEPVGPLWTFMLQQIAYRQLIYLVVIQSAVTALVGARLRWHQPVRTGQAAALTGDGAGGAAARTRKTMRQLRYVRHRGPLWARLTASTGVVLVLLSATSLGGLRIITQRYEDALHHADLLGPTAAYPDPDQLRDGPLDVLLVGIDWRQGESGLIRADTIMVLHIPRGLNHAYLFSIPRDSLVTIPPLAETGYPGGLDRLNAAFAYGAGDEQDRARGGRLLAQTLQKVTGLPGFSAAALIDFYGFTSVVQALGELDLCVDVETESFLSGVVYEPGCRRMDAISALDYVRQRKTLADGDYARQRHQQQFVKALISEARAQGALTDPRRLDTLIRSAAGALTVTTGPVSAIDFLLALKQISPERITMVRAPGESVHEPSGPYLGEQLLPEAEQLFAAARADTMDEFVAAHPDLVSQET